MFRHPSNAFARTQNRGRVLSALLLAVLVAGCARDAPDSFRIYVAEDGVYQVPFDALGSPRQYFTSAQLQLTRGEKDIPLWVEDGGDGRFEPGDFLSFVAQMPVDAGASRGEVSRYEVYRLVAGAWRPSRIISDALGTVTDTSESNVRSVRRFEVNRLRTILEREDSETWFWARLSHVDAPTFSFELPVSQHDAIIDVGLTGLSADTHAGDAGLKQHRVELLLNDSKIAEAEWDGQESVIMRAEGLNPELSLAATNRLEIRVPARTPENADWPLVDLSLLSWISVREPFESATAGQVRLDAGGGHRLVPRATLPGTVLYSPDGRRVELDTSAGPTRLDLDGAWHLVAPGGYMAPSWVIAGSAGRPDLRNRPAEYVIITHASLLEAVEPLAEWHRSEGLTVEIVDVDDVYDQFAYGLPTPEAIRDYLSHARTSWNAPALRYVLLAGDASWGSIGEPVDAESLHEEQIADRNLVPTMRVRAHGELAASDNALVQSSADDWRPELAIGRMPAGTPDELRWMIEKRLAYAREAGPGPWRREIAWVTDATESFQKTTSALAREAQLRGFSGINVFPDPAGQGDPQAPLLHAFDQGKLLVHFLGHGGRFVWRTGPIDYSRARDLFSMQDLTRLEPNARLPMVLSMTCSSGPFDHPNADSMAEAMLKSPSRGAIAVLAASWRVPPSQAFSSRLVRAITDGSTSIGEAVMAAKRGETNRWLVESYNLFGDPALKLASPTRQLSLNTRIQDGFAWVSTTAAPGEFGGAEVRIDWVDSDGESLKTDRGTVKGGSVEGRYRLVDEERRPHAVTVYIWNEAQGTDAFGSVDIEG